MKCLQAAYLWALAHMIINYNITAYVYQVFTSPQVLGVPTLGIGSHDNQLQQVYHVFPTAHMIINYNIHMIINYNIKAHVYQVFITVASQHTKASECLQAQPFT